MYCTTATRAKGDDKGQIHFIERTRYMLAADQVHSLFSDARILYEDALEQLEAGKVRNAAEKAWGQPSGPLMD
jgi:hypothetical protein